MRAGAWLNDCGTCGIDAGFFFLGRQTATEAFNSNQFPLITRPIFAPNIVPGTNAPLGENGEAVAVPGILSGTLTARGGSQLWGFDVNARKSLLRGCDCSARAEVFAGYRYLNLRESLTITENITVVGPGGDRVDLTDPIGTRVVVQDRFKTTNQFNGGTVGLRGELRCGMFTLTTIGKLAFGNMHQVLEIQGATTFADPNPLAGQETPERGVRLELRLIERAEPQGSIYAGVPIAFNRPVWRVDLFGSTQSPPGTLDRAHHHLRFNGWEPGRRHFVGWLRSRFTMRKTFSRINASENEPPADL